MKRVRYMRTLFIFGMVTYYSLKFYCMKSNLLVLVMLFSLSATAQKNFVVKGSFSQIPLQVQKVLIYYRIDDKNVVDSIEPKNGNYTFTGKIYEPMQATLRAKYLLGPDEKPMRTVSARDLVTVFLVPGAVEVSSVDSFGNATVKGSAAHDEYVKLNAMLKPVNELMSKYSAEYSKANAAKDETARKAAEDKLDSLDKISRGIYGDYARHNLESPIAMYALSQFAGWDIDVEAVEPIFRQLPAALKENPSAKDFAGKLDIARKTSIGSVALEFTQNDTLGVPVKLSSFRGKYLLIDFWASWCGPCRRENPNVVKTFQAYKDKNFQILGVSLDRPDAKDKWIEAIHQDNLTWTHVSDLKFWQNEVARLYGIQAIPQNLLLDPNGRIIAKNLNGDKLEKKLAEIFRP